MDNKENRVFSKTKIILLVIALIILSYGKFLWPQIFGRMFNDKVPFLEAVSDASLHSMAFISLVVIWVISYFLLVVTTRNTEHE